MHSSTVFDDSLLPVLLVRVRNGLSLQGQQEDMDRLTSYLQGQEQLILVVDMTGVGMLPAEQRQWQAGWFQENEALLCEKLLGCVGIVTSPLLRLSMSVVFYFKPLPIPQVAVPHLEAAMAWATKRLEETGQPLVASRIREQFLATQRLKK